MLLLVAEGGVTRRTGASSCAMHPERDADLHAWTQQVPEGDLAAHLKLALREYISRYAGQTIEVAVAVRRLSVPALPGAQPASMTTRPVTAATHDGGASEVTGRGRRRR